MSWKRERDGLIAQTLAFVQSVTGQPDETAMSETIAPLKPDTETRPSVGVAALLAIQTALCAKPPSAAPTAAPKLALQRVDPPSAGPKEAPAPRPIVTRPIVQSEMADEIRARVASFRAHQERFNREREEYFAATLARLKTAIKDAPPPRLGK